MSFWRRLFGPPQARGADRSLKLRLTRIRRLNRCYRGFLGLFLDAAEKQGGGYILDRQYIVSLVERAFRLGYEMVFHANVLCPGIALASYAELDRLRVASRDLLAGKREPPDACLHAHVAAPGESWGDRARDGAEPGDGLAVSTPTPEMSPAQLGEARRHRARLIENEGYVAFSGVASGRASLVESEADLRVFPDHGVLVAARLEPTAVLLHTLPRVAAILVEEARPADPIAVVARSFRVPTLLGVPGATRRLPAGEPVTVDAEDLVVYSGVFEELILHHLRQDAAKSEEPEFRLLNDVLRELGSPLYATGRADAPTEGPQTLGATLQGVYTTTLCQLIAGLTAAHESTPVASPGSSSGIRTVDLSLPAPKAPDSSTWLLAGLAVADGQGAGMTVTPPARGLLYRWEESVTALLDSGGTMMLLEAVDGGGQGSHVMVWGGEGSVSGSEEALDRAYADCVRLGLVAIRAGRTIAAWRERIPPGPFTETLTRLGQIARHTMLDYSPRPLGRSAHGA